ncbi:MAG: 6-carboxytetrahydropterin synthase [Candidatus Omnitrophica bacterium]|nr:6-carboxytetrahydropterin synthase [Candidatus Omnitrophota bacterium]
MGTNAEFSIKRQVFFCYGHRLRDYAGPCKNLHGHNAKVEIELASKQLDRKGMVADFIDVGRIMKNWIDKTFDHKLLLRQDDPLIPILKEQGEPLFIMEQNPTAEHIAQLIFEYATTQGLPVVSVTFWETEHAAATYSNP